MTRNSILIKVEKYGQCEVSRELVDKLFPQPDPMASAVLALWEHSPMTQREAVAWFCKQNGLRAIRGPFGNLLFRAKPVDLATYWTT